MRKARNIIGIIVALLAGAIYVSNTYLDIDLIGFVIPDTVKPVINVSELETTLYLNEDFDTDSVSCTDNRDANCTVSKFGSVDTSILGEHTLTFTAIDNAGNETVVTVTIDIIADEVEPVIDTSLVQTTVSLNGEFDATSVSCEDNLDLTCEVITTGAIDSTTVGEQTITFTATDSSGNIATIVFTVTVIEGIDTTVYVPAGYYNGIDGLTGEALKNALNDIITNHTEFPYTNTSTDVWDMLRDADEDPENSNNVILFYSGYSWPKDCQDTTTANLPDDCFENGDREADYTEWNREHIWSKSHGEFEEEHGEDAVNSGGYALGAHTDGHHLVAAERRMNSIKNNRFFDDCHDGIDDINVEDRGFGNFTCGEWYFEPRDEVKGDVARMLFYMVIRYEGEEGDYVDLELATDPEALDLINHIKDSKLPIYGKLAILLQWHLDDPVDEWEIERNEAIYQFQGNRNPFIDHPELVELIWGTPENPIDYYTN